MQGNVHSASAPARWRARHTRAEPRHTRAELGAHLRACCRQLWHGDSLRQEFASRPLAMFLREELALPGNAPPRVAMLSAASRLWGPALHALPWRATILCMKTFMRAACRTLLAIPQGESRIGAWVDVFASLELAGGIAFGAMAIVGLNTEDAGDVLVPASLFVPLAHRTRFACPLLRMPSAGIIASSLLRVGCRLPPAHTLHVAIRVRVDCIGPAKGVISAAFVMLKYRAEKDALFAAVDKEKSICEGARGRAQAANLANSRFHATLRPTMLEELRTPLHALLGFTEAVKCAVLALIKNASYRARAAAIYQIRLNWMSNALKFTPHGGWLTPHLAGTPEGGQMLTAKDSGIAPHLPPVLWAFGQGSLGRQTAEGSGLGLAILASAVGLNGATLELRSQSHGQKSGGLPGERPAPEELAARAAPSLPRPGPLGARPRPTTAMQLARSVGESTAVRHAHCVRFDHCLHFGAMLSSLASARPIRREAHGVPLHQGVRDRSTHRAVQGMCQVAR